ncbi:MAG: protoglobin domain-containing protein [Deltaproteobacteria bacterium]|nr:protoglobin domain-containing protein [Deltaproteobacteria bacterium]
MHPLDELKVYVGFDDDDDGRHLRALLPHVQPRARAIADHFYEIVLRFPDAKDVFADLTQVERLKVTLIRWIDEALTGPWDHAYYEHRRRIGHVHVKVGLPSQYMFTAMNRLMEDLHSIAERVTPTADAVNTARSLRRITDIELAIMLSTYIEAREKQGLEGLRDLLISHLPTTVLLVDKEGLVATSTTPWDDLFPGRKGVGLPIEQALHKDVVEKAQLTAHLARATATGREIVVPRVDVILGGALRTLRVAVIPLNHPLANALVHIEDLTDTLASEARAKQAEHLARLGTMAATVAHEIRNPLAGISGTVQVIGASLPEDDPRRVALSKVQDQIQRLGGLVGDLLSFARPISAQIRRVDLVAISRGAVVEANASTGQSATVEGAGEAFADGALLEQVLLNLVQNAWQAGALNVVLKVMAGGVDVDDDGPGIPAEEQDRVFEPFFTTKLRGTGLGLPTARKMMQAMRGTLELGASRGGASFKARLPTEPL